MEKRILFSVLLIPILAQCSSSTSLPQTGSTVTMLNLHSRQVVETGFVVGINDSGAIPGCQFDGGSMKAATTLTATTWSCALPSGSNTWRLGSAHTIAVGALASGELFNMTQIAVTQGNNKDINGDGYPDLVVGAPGYSTFTGAVYIYYGGSGDFASATTLIGTSTAGYFGTSVALGDVNGDGYADIIVGAEQYSSDTGAVYVFHGSNTGPSTIPTTTITGGSSNGFFGSAVAVGDINGDGYADLVVAAINTSSAQGAVFVYPGSINGISTTVMTTLNGTAASEQFGSSIAVGDVNGDGYADLAVGANGYSSTTGAVFVYLGGNSGLNTFASTTLVGGASSNEQFGASVALGDINGDGYADLAVGASAYSSSTGAAYIFNGTNSGTSPTLSATLTASAPTQQFGNCVAFGDVNGDGYADLVVGAYQYSSFTGAAYVYSGSLNGLSTNPANTFLGPTGTTQFGYSIATSDFNGDGNSDMIIGAWNYQSQTGAVYLFNGGSHISDAPTLSLTGSTTGLNFGFSLAQIFKESFRWI